jgi:RHS repeat-associated protein
VLAAMRVDGTLYYVLADQTCSASVVMDASGTVVGETRYYPFGETRDSSGSMFTDHLYTGQQQMANLGLYYYGARFPAPGVQRRGYSPSLGKFIQADTIVPNMSDPQTLNRYSYANNNPIPYNDPSGHMVPDEVDPYGRKSDNKPTPPTKSKAKKNTPTPALFLWSKHL